MNRRKRKKRNTPRPPPDFVTTPADAAVCSTGDGGGKAIRDGGVNRVSLSVAATGGGGGGTSVGCVANEIVGSSSIACRSNFGVPTCTITAVRLSSAPRS